MQKVIGYISKRCYTINSKNYIPYPLGIPKKIEEELILEQKKKLRNSWLGYTNYSVCPLCLEPTCPGSCDKYSESENSPPPPIDKTKNKIIYDNSTPCTNCDCPTCPGCNTST